MKVFIYINIIKNSIIKKIKNQYLSFLINKLLNNLS